jgi:hypothetical protein
MTLSGKVTTIVFAALLTVAPPGVAWPQSQEENWRFLQEILEAANGVSQDTARESYAACTGLSKRLAGMTGMEPAQRLYFEAEIESCLFYAMNNGNFSDATGDACSHLLTYATRLSEVIVQGKDQPGDKAEMMQTLGERLESAMRMGADLECTGDFASFGQAVEVAKQAAAAPPPPPPLAFLENIMNAQSGLQPETAEQVQQACLALRDKIPGLVGVSTAEKLFYESQIENCVSIAKQTGGHTDALGDVCDHHFRMATKLAETVAAAKGDPTAADMLLPLAQAELETAQRQGPGMGCTQDYKSLTDKL